MIDVSKTDVKHMLLRHVVAELSGAGPGGKQHVWGHSQALFSLESVFGEVPACYDPARDRRAIAQVEGARDIRGREADCLSSPRVCGRGEEGSRAQTMREMQNEN